MRLYMTVQKRAALGLLAGEGTYVLYKVLISLVDLTPKERRKIDMLSLWDDAEPEPDASEDENEGELSPFDTAIISLDDIAVKIILKEFDTNVLANALNSSAKRTRKKIYNNMWRREAAMLDEDIEYMGKEGRSEDAQQMILTFIQNLADYVPSNTAPRSFDNVGRYKWSDGTVYEGCFAGSKFHGKGKMTYADGGVYEGDFTDGKKSGKGKFTWPDGTFYEGDFADGKRNGSGKMTYADGKVEEGNWKEDEFLG
jgi:hypothetical protein